MGTTVPAADPGDADHSAGSGPPSIAVPRGACDCHMHVFDDAFPPARTAVLTHAPARLAAYRRLQARLGLQRHVIVQPSVYGLDNRLLLQSLAAAGTSARGVAVIDDRVTDDQLQALSAQRVVGVRFNLVQRGVTQIGMLSAVASRIQSFDWHVQLHLPPDELLAHEDLIAALPVPVVLDHWGRVASQPSKEVMVAASIQRLLARGNTWVKLSGAYLASHSRPPYADLAVHAQAWATARPDRLLWGTDWPHATEAEKPDDAELMDLLAQWLPDPGVRNAVLVTNPERLYGFEHRAPGG
ncbi:amidohydrolase family protein [Caldimonas sp. KR1-144]|uniref:amidohydrolase family protein n=1 Tax=Caldimonas sp. KR1-144 TaxID=3400911 RepID=UPI003BFD6B18